MHKKTIVAVFYDLDVAKDVINDLLANHYKRADIGLAVGNMNGRSPGKALVTLTVPPDDVYRMKQVFRFHNPEELDVRDAQWRIDGNIEFNPNEEEFAAVAIEQQRSGSRV
jgi:hypothetical protein